ncbi:MAG: competence protein ComEC, partial [Thermoleophilaceae bacterium]|nr:competence protein ComEC [Thermoleophilaceae bacterium]
MHRFLLAFAAAAGAALCPASAGAAVKTTTGPCGVGAQSPQCFFWTGRVTFIGDADTVSVVLDGDKSRHPINVRLTGINATESYVHTNDPQDRVGECHANEATDRLQSMIAASKGRVRLSAQNPSSHSGTRPRRAVAVNIGGRWRDVGRTLLNEGHALWLPNKVEYAWNNSYSIIAARAAEKHIGIWDPQHCAPGPSQGQKLKLWVNSDAPGSDSTNPNGEWVKIKNLDDVNPVPIGGWWVRDSDLRRYMFPAGATIPPNSTITMFVGGGIDTPSEFFWGLSGGVFDNGSRGINGAGDGAYLFDPDGDVRAFMQYPCRWHCADPLAGAVRLDVHPAGQEYVDVTNVSSGGIDLESYRLIAGGYVYPFP